MTAETDVKSEGLKVDIEEKCASDKDMSPMAVGGGVGDCTRNAKVDYIFVNGSDCTSDDRLDHYGDGEYIVSDSNVDSPKKPKGVVVNGCGGLSVQNGDSIESEDVGSVEAREITIENREVVEKETGVIVEGGKLVKENGDGNKPMDVVEDDGGVLVAQNGFRTKLESEVEVEGSGLGGDPECNENSIEAECEVEVGGIESSAGVDGSAELEIEYKVEGGESVAENGSASNQESGDWEFVMKNCGHSNSESSKVKSVHLEVEMDAMRPEFPEIKDKELDVENQESNSFVDDGALAIKPLAFSSHSSVPPHVSLHVDNGDGIVNDIIEGQNGVVVSKSEPQALDEKCERIQLLVHDVEPQRFEVEVKQLQPPDNDYKEAQDLESKTPPQQFEVDGTVLQPFGDEVKESQPVGEDNLQMLQGEVRESKTPDGEIVQLLEDEGESQPVESEVKGFQLSDREIEEMHPVDAEVQVLKPLDGRTEALELLEGKVEVDKQDDFGSATELGENQESKFVDSVASGGELAQIDDGFQVEVISQTEKCRELQKVGMPSDEIAEQHEPELPAEAEDCLETQTADLHFNTVSCKELVEGDGKSELGAEVAGNQGSQMEVTGDVQLTQGMEEVGLASVIKKEGSEEFGMESRVAGTFAEPNTKPEIAVTRGFQVDQTKIIFGSFGYENYEATFSHHNVNMGTKSLNCGSNEGVSADEASTSSLEGLGIDSFDGQNVSAEEVKRPFHYLVKIPKYDDEKLKEQIKLAAAEVEDKTRKRDAVQAERCERRDAFRNAKNNWEAAKLEHRAASDLYRAKKQEKDSAQALSNHAKNVVTIEDVDSRIHFLEHKIGHETLPLNEEKQLINEIKQLKLQREQLSSYSRRVLKLQHAVDQNDNLDEQLKALRKEMDAHREKLCKAEAASNAAKKKYVDEAAALNVLDMQFKSADDIRQKAYVHLQSLRKQLSEKNKYFWRHNNDAEAAKYYALSCDKEALEHHCVSQVEAFMELWSKNDEFRRDYVRCNARSTLRRLRTLDGRSLGPDEEPPSLGVVANGCVIASTTVNSARKVPDMEHDLSVKAEVSIDRPVKKAVERTDKTITAGKRGKPTVSKNAADSAGIVLEEGKEEQKPSKEKKAVEQTDETIIAGKRGKPTSSMNAEASTRIMPEEGKEEQKPSKELSRETKEEEKLARKEEELGKEEEAAILKEQRWLEEKAKAQEALERKRRNAERAQAKAEFRAQKEAERKEKEREKRARKKERMKGVSAVGSTEIEATACQEALSESVKEPENKESPVVVTKRSHKPLQYAKKNKVKSIPPPPPPLRNRGRRRLQQWIWVLLSVVIVLALFYLGNLNFSRIYRILNFGSNF